jgi:hypothetical protein
MGKDENYSSYQGEAFSAWGVEQGDENAKK